MRMWTGVSPGSDSEQTCMRMDDVWPNHERFSRCLGDQRVSRLALRTSSFTKTCVCMCDCDELRCPVLLQGPVTQGFHQSLPPPSSYCCPFTTLIAFHPASATFLNQTRCLLFYLQFVSSMPSNTFVSLETFFVHIFDCPLSTLSFIFASFFLSFHLFPVFSLSPYLSPLS